MIPLTLFLNRQSESPSTESPSGDAWGGQLNAKGHGKMWG